MLKKSKVKATDFKETTTPTQGTLYRIRAAHLFQFSRVTRMRRTAWDALNAVL